MRKTKALLGLGLGQFEHDKLGGMEAKALSWGRRIQVDVGTIVAPEWKDGTIIDVNITRTGIRYKLFFDDGTDQLLSFTRDALNLKFTDGDAPDLSFLPAGEKLSKSKNTQLEMKIAIANAKFKSAKRPSNPADRARIADLARPKKPREEAGYSVRIRSVENGDACLKVSRKNSRRTTPTCGRAKRIQKERLLSAPCLKSLKTTKSIVESLWEMTLLTWRIPMTKRPTALDTVRTFRMTCPRW